MILRESQLIALVIKTHLLHDASAWLTTRPRALSTYPHMVTWGGFLQRGWGGGRANFLREGWIYGAAACVDINAMH